MFRPRIAASLPHASWNREPVFAALFRCAVSPLGAFGTVSQNEDERSTPSVQNRGSIMSPILAFWESPPQLILVAFIALLLFGKRLPELMRSLGKGITEFKKGMSGIEEELNRGSNTNTSSYLPPPSYHESARPLPAEERPEITAPKFQPPTSAPTTPPTHVS